MFECIRFGFETVYLCLFLTHMGEPFDRRQLTALVRRFLIDAKVARWAAAICSRHTVAMLMLENSGDIRVISEMPGHARHHHGTVHASVHQLAVAMSTPRRIPPRS